MARSAANADLPPEYAADGAAVRERLPPDTLRLAGRSIHSATSRDMDAPGRYELNHQMDFLRETDRLVEFSRIDYAIKRQAGGNAAAAASSVPEITSQPRHAFNLERPPAILQEAFPYYIKPVSRSGLGNIGLKFTRIGKSVCKAWRVGRRRATSGKDRDTLEYEARGLLFDVRRNNDVLDWFDGAKNRVAVEYSNDNMYSLNVLVPMDQAMRDALVASWCVKLWNDLAVKFHERRNWKHGKSDVFGLR
ncbi:uncharacterized protein GLRG_10887 [Colletotrichum graminicola M1.001]|uniref:Uncharacterized protein n=1 Tax=Colletotrichum graminicola (strain M1.001 / M2 / FGSC 10212) TaxID=645133 RepID=E3QXZ4_COLGM|nr:uncharacterized protein GLRG_10887 [Colletotrichum graminicola M1.001]EFQ35732.1 hypothetical protein GLRG_10887 [Colletotrichum graminicola M1.001]